MGYLFFKLTPKGMTQLSLRTMKNNVLTVVLSKTNVGFLQGYYSELALTHDFCTISAGEAVQFYRFFFKFRQMLFFGILKISLCIFYHEIWQSVSL